MKLKGDRPREIDVPYSLMEDLWWYAVRHRPSRARQSSSQTNALFLNEEGEQYGDQALTDIFGVDLFSLSKVTVGDRALA